MIWRITTLEAYPELEGRSNVVFTAHWDVIDTQQGFTGRVYGTVGVTLDPDAPYTPFNELTEPQVIGWVKDALGADTVTAHEAAVTKQIADQINPPVIRPQLPW